MKNINFSGILHLPYGEYAYTLSDGRVCLMLRTEKDNWDEATVVLYRNYGERFCVEKNNKYNMVKIASDDLYDYYKACFLPIDKRFCYVFQLCSSSVKLYYTYDGIKTIDELYDSIDIPVFNMAYSYPMEDKPQWAKGAIAYEIFPDRFCRVGRQDKSLEKWDSKNLGSEHFFGGNIKGIISKVNYLKRLGVKLVYLTPIFKSDTSHRYNTYSYFEIDHMLGTKEDLKALADELHKNNMYIILDGVFNHCGTQFSPFVDAVEKAKNSQYYDWFFFGEGEDGQFTYETFANEKSMPKLNLKNEACAEYFCTVGEHWISECDIDGWRLDVANEVYPDFWRAFRKRIKQIKNEAILIAESWHDSRQWCLNGDMLDASMNYVWSKAVWALFAKSTLSINDMQNQIVRNYLRYPDSINDLHWNILGSHDTERFLTRAENKIQALEAAVFYQFTSKGMPLIYYGDELGMKGENDPYCRSTIDWNNNNDNMILRYYKQLSTLRNKYEALQYGDYRTYYADDEQGIYAYTRTYNNDTILCIICAKNVGITKFTLKLPIYLAKRIFLRDEISGERYNCSSTYLTLPFKYGKCYCFPYSKTLDQLSMEEK